MLFAAVSRASRPDRKVVFAPPLAGALSADGAPLCWLPAGVLFFFISGRVSISPISEKVKRQFALNLRPLLCAQLRGVQLIIRAAPLKQLRMRALLDDFAVVDDQNDIGLPDG